MYFNGTAVLTDSLVYRITTKDYYNNLAKDLLNFSEKWLPLIFLRTTLLYRWAKKKSRVCLKMKRIVGRTIHEFIVLCKKFYAYNIKKKTITTVKGIRGHVFKNHPRFDNHKRFLLKTDDEKDAE